MARERLTALGDAPRLAQRFAVAPLAELAPAATAEAAAMARMNAWNAARHSPRQIGFLRSLPAPQQVRLEVPAAPEAVVAHDGGILARTSLTLVGWGASVRVAGAYRLRLHLTRVVLPANARLWVHGDGGSMGPFGSETITPQGDLWTPSLGGENLAIDVEAPAAQLAAGAGYGFVIDGVMELFPGGRIPAAPAVGAVDAAGRADIAGVAEPHDDSTCEVDASCEADSFAGYNAARHAAAVLNFVTDRQSFACTGELLNDSASDGIPYLLTANHCISTQATAATLDTFFDYYSASCNNLAPALDSLPRTTGGTLLANAAAASSSDFALVKLPNLPAGRTFLGWNSSASAAPDGTNLYRLSYPGGELQKFSVSAVNSQSALCAADFPLGRFIYSDNEEGAAAEGSSGSAALLANGQVVGQLYGVCGQNTAQTCDPSTHPLDGAFANDFPALKPFLAPGAPTRCVPGPLTLCLDGKRFEVQVSWANQFNNTAGAGHAIVASDSSGYFWFTDPSNYELILKVLNFGTGFKVFYGELTDLHFTVTISDTKTGLVKTYSNTTGDCGAVDNSAFPESAPLAARLSIEGAAGAGMAGGAPGAAAPAASASCAPNSSTLCLLGRRFAVRATWKNQFDGTSGNGLAGRLSDSSGNFSFASPGDIEVVAKVVPFPNEITFFYGSLSNLQYTLIVTDTRSGATKTYQNAAGNYCGGLDNDAFPP